VGAEDSEPTELLGDGRVRREALADDALWTLA